MGEFSESLLEKNLLGFIEQSLKHPIQPHSALSRGSRMSASRSGM